jgi:tight adherence protein C
VKVLLGLIASAGIVLFVSGLPVFRQRTITDRVDPYVLGSEPLASVGPKVHSRLARVADGLARRLFGSPTSSLDQRLASAGLTADADAFRLQQMTWGLGASVVVLAMWAATLAIGLRFDARVIPLLTVLCFVTGFLARDWWLGRQIERRRNALREALPTAIDLLTLSIMGGESVPAAFARTSAALPGIVAEEFGAVVADIRSGATVVDALDAMGRRIPDSQVSRFIDALCIGIEKGAPLAETLRAQADDGREARRRELLESAGRREILMLVPVVFLIMPVVVLFALWPGLVTLDLLVP